LQNAVSGRLNEAPIEEIKRMIYTPGILRADDDDFRDMCAMNQAHFVMLAENKLIPAEAVAPLAQAMSRMEAEGRGAVPTDPELEDSYFAFESRLTALAGGDVAGRLHTGRSRNDIGATLDRMRARRRCLAILDALHAARGACLAKALQHRTTIIPGYTHLQPAQPITFGFYLVSVANALGRDAERLMQAYHRIDQNTLGTAALAGTSFGIDRLRTSELLGFAAVLEPGLDAVASRDFVTELMFAATALSVHWSRVAQDMYTFCTHEFSSVLFPDRVAGTSSIMPQKKNPIALEYLRAEAGRSIGALAGSLASIKGTNFSIALDALREGLFDAWAMLGQIPGDLALFQKVIENAEPDAQRLEQRCRANFATATDLADGMVREAGIPFRDAHHIVGAVVRAAVEAGKTAEGIDRTMVDAASVEMIGRPLGLSDSFIKSCLDPRQAVEARRTLGGTAAAEVTRMVEAGHARIVEDQAWLDRHRAVLQQASEQLKARLDTLAGSA
jgi:argininosuccinate lyase